MECRVPVLSKFMRGVIFNDVDPELLETPYDLGAGWTLRKATTEELNNRQVRFSLASWAQRRGYIHGYPANLQDIKYISDTHIYNAPPSSEGELHKIARLAVVESSDQPKIEFHLLQSALSICDAELKIGLFLHPDRGYSHHWTEFTGFRAETHGAGMGELFLPRPSTSDLLDIRETMELVANGVPEKILQAIGLFMSLDRLPDDIPMKDLGYFTVIESLLSHVPNASGPVDSIQRQLNRNLVLIDNRLKQTERRLGFEDFENAKPETVVSKIYGYRSAIAHGSSLEEKLKAIENIAATRWKQGKPSGLFFDWFRRWLRRMVRRVLFAAIREPELITDLT